MYDLKVGVELAMVHRRNVSGELLGEMEVHTWQTVLNQELAESLRPYHPSWTLKYEQFCSEFCKLLDLRHVLDLVCSVLHRSNQQ